MVELQRGYKVWSNQDPIGTKVSKAVGHLIQSQAPLTGNN
jgi:hypothetical protein